MEKKIGFKLGVFAILCIFVMALGINCFATDHPSSGNRWTYLSSCGYDFDLLYTTSTKKYFYFIGSTSTISPYDAYVRVELQRDGDNGWETVYTIQDQDYVAAAAEKKSYGTAYNYTYRLKIVHKVKDSSNNTLETYTHYSYTL